jgi:predicted secreted Zn-dependent protease
MPCCVARDGTTIAHHPIQASAGGAWASYSLAIVAAHTSGDSHRALLPARRTSIVQSFTSSLKERCNIAGIVNFKGQTITSKFLKGQTLAEIDRDRKKSGLVDPNDKSQKFYGVTDVTIRLVPGGPRSIGAPTTLSHGTDVMVRLTECTAEVSAATTVCKPKDLSMLSGDARKEWDRFEKAVDSHEKLHVEDGKALAQSIVDEVISLNASGKGETIEDAYAAAVWELEKLFNKKFGGGEIEKRISAEMKNRDGKDKHGEKSGAVLKTSIR